MSVDVESPMIVYLVVVECKSRAVAKWFRLNVQMWRGLFGLVIPESVDEIQLQTTLPTRRILKEKTRNGETDLFVLARQAARV